MKTAVEPDNARLVDRMPQEARDFLQIGSGGMRIYQVPFGMKEHADNPADKVLGEFFDAMFRGDDGNEVVNKGDVH